MPQRLVLVLPACRGAAAAGFSPAGLLQCGSGRFQPGRPAAVPQRAVLARAACRSAAAAGFSPASRPQWRSSWFEPSQPAAAPQRPVLARPASRNAAAAVFSPACLPQRRPAAAAGSLPAGWPASTCYVCLIAIGIVTARCAARSAAGSGWAGRGGTNGLGLEPMVAPRTDGPKENCKGAAA